MPRERQAGDERVALVPELVAGLRGAGHELLIERGAGAGAGYLDEAYEAQGAVLATRQEVLASELVTTVGVPSPEDIDALRPGGVLVGMLAPLSDPRPAAALAARGVNAFSLELVPRISRAQGMDVLSAMSTVSGYRAVLEAALLSRRFFPMLMTAAGTLTPARVLILGAGVAGLQAIATARRLGAVVEAFDARDAAREQVESLGAGFLGLPPLQGEGEGGYARAMAADEEAREREFLAPAVARADVVITTALVPGRRAPLLVDEAMALAMRPGSVIVDLAADAGGNCSLTKAGEHVVRGPVTVFGPSNPAAAMARPASQLYARATSAFVSHLLGTGVAVPAATPAPGLPDDAIVRGAALVWAGAVVNEATRRRLEEASHG